MRLMGLVSWPLWYDIETGNVMVFVVLAAAWALRGSRVGIAAFLGISLLIPRPLMVPLVAWTVWNRPQCRVPFFAATVIQLIAVTALGWTGEWATAMLAASGDALNPSNVGPSRFVGVVPWLCVGVPLAALLTRRGRIGWASLAVSPYWLPYYLLMPLLELSMGPNQRRLSAPPQSS
jgi:hypothetical protein